VRATSADGSVRDQVFAISVMDLNEFDVSPVVDASSVVNGVNENSAIGTVVGIRAQAFDADGTNNTVTYTLTNNDGGRFAINAVTGEVTVAGAIDREADGATRTVRVRATSADGSISEETYLINIYDVDEFDVAAISDLNLAPNAVLENSAVGTVVGYQAFFVDADATTNVIAYSLDDNAGGRFAINTLTGVVTVANRSGLNFEANSSHSITVRALSDDGSLAVITVGIAVLDVAERPVGFADRYSTSYIDVLRVFGAGVLANDTDQDGNVLSIEMLVGPSNGVLAFSSNGQFVYTPTVGFIGEVTFVYRAFDGGLYSDPITVTIDVILPKNVQSDSGNAGSSGSTSSNGNGSTQGDSGSTAATGNAASSSAPVGSPTQEAAPTNNVPVESDLPTVLGAIEDKESNKQGIAESRESRRIGDLSGSLSQRVSRIRGQDDWALLDFEQMHSFRSHEDFAMPNAILSSTDENHANDDNHPLQVSLNIGTIVSTVLGTGAVLWVLQATQIAATFITAAAPAWMHVDIASSLNGLSKEHNANDEASAKIFEK